MQILVFTNYAFSHPALNKNIEDLMQGFRELGHEVIPCINENKNLKRQAIGMIRDNSVDLTIGVNNMWLAGEQENQNCPHVTVLMDEPCNKFSDGYDKVLPKHLITYLDRSDNDMFKHIFSSSKYRDNSDRHTLFMPLGGAKDASTINFEDRPFDIVFSSSFWPIEDTPPWKADTSINPRIKKLLDDALYIMQNFPVNVRDAFNEVLKSRGMMDEEYKNLAMPYFWHVLSYVKPWRKIQTVKKLAATGRKIHIIGAGYPKGSWTDCVEGENIVFHGTLRFDMALKIMQKSKVLVTDEACFNDGAHDRVFTGMLNGAAVVAEYSSYLSEILENQKDIFFYDWQNTDEHLSIVHKLIEDDDFRISTAKNMYNYASQEHTWKKRAENILETLAILYGDYSTHC